MGNNGISNSSLVDSKQKLAHYTFLVYRAFHGLFKGQMMDWLKELEAYLHDILGQEFAIGSVHEKEMNGLPLYLTKAYTPLELVLFGKK
ncbi:MAG: hypothetical protein JXR76_04310, partial [Deltaproteobacteria bacterium]|nr:hypothetical protein [Deltaproteobacteria bacterium]